MIKDYINSQAYVDLGLPSGNLWATCDVGAHKPWECGEYFSHNKLIELGLIEGVDENNLILPNDEDFKELWENSTNSIYWLYGQKGLVFTSLNNGKSIFIPCFGFKSINGGSSQNLGIVYLFTASTVGATKTTFIYDSKDGGNKNIRLAKHSSDYLQHIRLIKKSC